MNCTVRCLQKIGGTLPNTRELNLKLKWARARPSCSSLSLLVHHDRCACANEYERSIFFLTTPVLEFLKLSTKNIPKMFGLKFSDSTRICSIFSCKSILFLIEIFVCQSMYTYRTRGISFVAFSAKVCGLWILWTYAYRTRELSFIAFAQNGDWKNL